MFAPCAAPPPLSCHVLIKLNLKATTFVSSLSAVALLVLRASGPSLPPAQGSANASHQIEPIAGQRKRRIHKSTQKSRWTRLLSGTSKPN